MHGCIYRSIIPEAGIWHSLGANFAAGATWAHYCYCYYKFPIITWLSIVLAKGEKYQTYPTPQPFLQ